MRKKKAMTFLITFLTGLLNSNAKRIFKRILSMKPLGTHFSGVGIHTLTQEARIGTECSDTCL